MFTVLLSTFLVCTEAQCSSQRYALQMDLQAGGLCFVVSLVVMVYA